MIPETAKYEIRVRDVLGEKWTTCFTPFMVTPGIKETLLTGETHDQAELYGVLLKIRDMGLRLVSVVPVQEKMEATEAKPVGTVMTVETAQDILYT